MNNNDIQNVQSLQFQSQVSIHRNTNPFLSSSSNDSIGYNNVTVGQGNESITIGKNVSFLNTPHKEHFQLELEPYLEEKLEVNFQDY